MTTTARFGVVALGYVLAFVVASAVVAVRTAATAQAAQSAGGMYAFGDTLLFLAVFGGLASVPTAVALWMLRGSHLVWLTLGAVAAAVACFGAGLIAPHRIPRAMLVVAAVVQAAVGAGIVMLWLASSRG